MRNFNYITSLHFDLNFQFSYYDCPLAGYTYDFRHMFNLKHLTVKNCLLELIRVHYDNLVSVSLRNIHDHKNYTSYGRAFNESIANANKLQLKLWRL